MTINKYDSREVITDDEMEQLGKNGEQEIMIISKVKLKYTINFVLQKFFQLFQENIL